MLRKKKALIEIIESFTIILKLAFFVGLCYLVLIVNFGQIVYLWWLNNSLPYDFWVMYLLGCQVVMTVLWTWGGNLLMATNRHEEYARWQFPVNLVALFLSYWGAVEFGLLGAVAGLFAGQLFPMLFIVYFLLKQKGWHQIAFSLVIASFAGLVLLPMTLNFWSASLGIALVLVYSYRWNKR
jgi:O-antigen/teichoic acid export membrane protein